MTGLQIYYGRVGFFQRVLERKPIHRGFNEWKHCCGRLYHDMGLNQICWVSFEIASLMCCQLEYALKLSHGAWLVLPVKVAALRCVPCALCCVLPRSCVQPRHWANSRCGTSQLKMAQFPKRSAKSELLWRNLYYRCCDEHSGGILCLFCFLCVNLSMILIIEKVIKLFWVFFNFSSHKVKCPIKIFEQKQPGAFFSSPFSLVFNLLGFLAFSWPLWTLFWENGWRTLIFLHILPSRSYTLCSTILTFICKWSKALKLGGGDLLDQNDP